MPENNAISHDTSVRRIHRFFEAQYLSDVRRRHVAIIQTPKTSAIIPVIPWIYAIVETSIGIGKSAKVRAKKEDIMTANIEIV